MPISIVLYLINNKKYHRSNKIKPIDIHLYNPPNVVKNKNDTKYIPTKTNTYISSVEIYV